MWHVIAPIVRWPLHSPWRLAGVVTMLLVVIFVAGEINGDDRAPAVAATDTAETTATPSDEPTSSSSSSTSPTTGTHFDESSVDVDGSSDADSLDPTETNESVAAATAAADFVSEWARPDLAAATWLAGVRPLVTPELLEGLEATDPANLPDVAVSGEPVQVAISKESGVFDVPTTGEHVRVFVELDRESSTWLVSSVEPTN
jgi:hypothetical protein